MSADVFLLRLRNNYNLKISGAESGLQNVASAVGNAVGAMRNRALQVKISAGSASNFPAHRRSFLLSYLLSETVRELHFIVPLLND